MRLEPHCPGHSKNTVKQCFNFSFCISLSTVNESVSASVQNIRVFLLKSNCIVFVDHDLLKQQTTPPLAMLQ